jgi:enolase
MAEITDIRAREILDSRGNPTVEVDVACGPSTRGRTSVPSGASTGRHEAVERRDADPARYGGRGVLGALASIRQVIAPKLVGQDAADQPEIDRRLIELDGTPQKSHLGANATLAVSLACAHAAAAARQVPLFAHLANLWAARSGPHANHRSLIADDALASPSIASSNDVRAPARTMPVPMVNMISGGLHAGGNIDFQDFLIIPVGATSYSEALRWIVQVYRSLGRVLAERGYEAVLVGDEGGFGPKLPNNRDAVELIVHAIAAAGFEPRKQIAIAIDVASSHFFRDGRYRLAATGGTEWSADQLADELADWVRRYPIVSIEDGCAEDDWSGWRVLTDRLGKQVQLIGDDLFATNPKRLALGIESRVANAILIKPNQIGTLTETLDVLALAQLSGYHTIVSARSGETEDHSITHLAVATGAGQIKIGSIARSERLAKYNELLRIEEELGDRARFSGDLFSTP